MNLTLFRGDSILNRRTEPGLYRGNGLRSKAFGKANPMNIMKNGLLEAIRIHVNHTGAFEEALYNLTGYLSFSQDKGRAFVWAGGDAVNMISVGNDYTETRYIFDVNILLSDLREVADSVFEYLYPCNTKLVAGNSSDPLNVLSAAMQNTVCHVCNNTEKVHSLLLIDAVGFLRKHRGMANYRDAYDNSVRDREWLLWPNDSLGSQQSARIPRANFWSAEHYRLSTEAPRDPKLFSQLGYL